MNSNNGSRKKILLIGWDAADWEHINPLLDQGLLPHLESFINTGVIGNLATLQPVLSPMLWNSAATGKYPHKHGIHGFVEPDHHNGGARPFSSYSRKCKALWNIFSQQGLKSNVINWWASHPAEPVDGCVVSNAMNGVRFEKGEPVVTRGLVHPEAKARHYAQFKVLPRELEAEQICAFIPNAADINQDEDSRLQMFANVMAETLTTHGVATEVMASEPWDFMAVYYTSIDHFCHGFMPYHPPRQSHVPEADFEIFNDVITGAYRFSDMMLGRLMHLAGEDAIVILCSDHGFLSGTGRPIGQPREPAGPAAWHRHYGIFMMKGPGIKKDERIYGASLIDIAPTILAAAGMPVGEDMDGRPLLEAFEEPPEVETIPSWEGVEGPYSDGMHQDEKPLNAEEAEELMQQFVALGYVEDPGGDKDKQFEMAVIESKYNLARSYVFADWTRKSIPLFEELVSHSPWETRFIIQLLQAYQKVGRFNKALELIDSAFDIETTRYGLVKIVWVEIQVSLGRTDDDLIAFLNKIEETASSSATQLKRIGQTYARLRRWRDAERVYRRAIELHEENADVWQGLSRVYCRLGQNQDTIDCALRAVSLRHRLPHAHLNLGIGLARSGQFDRAVLAFDTALQFSPGFVPAHRWLVTLYLRELDNPELAERHKQLAAKFLDKQQRIRSQPADRHETSDFELPEFLSEAGRMAKLLEERPDRQDPRKPTGRCYTIVSGLPRSGTSLMMQMLEAGGLPAKTDGERIADDDNPRGYYEWEAIKKVKTNPDVLDEEGLEQKAIKAVTMVLEELPYAHNYKIIFMSRPIEEVASSQQKMIERLQSDAPDQTGELMQRLVAHRNYVRAKIESNPRMQVLEIDYPTLIEAPQEMAKLIGEFLGTEILPHPENMAAVVDPTLYRQKKSEG
ncbi:MAG: alkaline phosphatase family protein [Planctomycetota bacterium]